jgi:hypothetical protein
VGRKEIEERRDNILGYLIRKGEEAYLLVFLGVGAQWMQQVNRQANDGTVGAHALVFVPPN